MVKINIVEDTSEIKSIMCGIGMSLFGRVFLGICENGVICYCSFVPDSVLPITEMNHVRRLWKNAILDFSDDDIAPIVGKIFDKDCTEVFNVKLTGSVFQMMVWKELAKVEEGKIIGASLIARNIGRPKSRRAVGLAVAHNHIAYLIPCHRFITTSCGVGNYRWGTWIKKDLLIYEQAI